MNVRYVLALAFAASQLAGCAAAARPVAAGAAEGTQQDGIPLIIRLTEPEAVSKLREVLAASGYTIVSPPDDARAIRTAPRAHGDAQLTVTAQLFPADYPEGRRTVVVFTAVYSNRARGIRSRQLTAEAEPELWAVLTSLADTFATAARRLM